VGAVASTVARVGPTIPTRAGRLADASVDPIDGRKVTVRRFGRSDRRAQGDRPTLRSIRPTRAAPELKGVLRVRPPACRAGPDPGRPGYARIRTSWPSIMAQANASASMPRRRAIASKHGSRSAQACVRSSAASDRRRHRAGSAAHGAGELQRGRLDTAMKREWAPLGPSPALDQRLTSGIRLVRS
jgi:hypothetical protein